ncbi:hypothetical protein PHLCEN_2v5332 [Hermanssonia centrifuga]|uniref:Uncharacterized protein n=1 Tax=Hermanssonia centrifuga TaxID=98765 RepID=A0A2R6P630_9APHY|nr:hypothetical protein PHLCEN_2v5332 [Hermanssonia centrifuga]
MSLDDREDKAVSVVNKEGISENGQIRRGWWDYVPEHSLSDTQLRHISPRTRTTSDHSGITQYTGSKLQNTRSYPQGEVPVLVPHRKPSLPEGRPIRQPSRTSTVTFSSSNSRDTPGGGVRLTVPRRNQTYPTIPPSPSAVSRLSKYMPRLQLFRQVLKNEVRKANYKNLFDVTDDY